MNFNHAAFDLSAERHLARQEIENYVFLRETGAGHEEALERSGMTEDAYWRYRKRGLIEPDASVSNPRWARKNR